MQITKVQEQKNGYLVNHSIFVPNAQDNSDYQAIQKWIADGGIVEAFDYLAEAKLTKIAQLKTKLISAKELETPRKGSLESYEIDGVFRTFKVKLSDLATVVARVSRLEKAAVGTTAQWTDIDGNRLDLNLEQFQCLRNHLDVRDQNLHTLYEAMKSEIKACTTLEELEAIEITFQK